MNVEFLLEEESAEEALRLLLPGILPDHVTIQTYVLSGKTRMLNTLPQRLAGYSRWMPADYRIVVAIDRDQDDCQALKERIERIISTAGLVSKTASGADCYQAATRIVVQELEAWFLGDMHALRAAYPRVPAGLEKQRSYRDPDAMRRPADVLLRILKGAGYYEDSKELPKRETARNIAPHMEPARNRRASFQCFHALLTDLAK